MPSEAELDLGRYRAYLQVLARLYLDERLRGKIDASDVVQQALLQGHQARDQFHGQMEPERASWLRQILARCLANAQRDFGREKRDVARERSLEAALDASSRLADWLANAQPSPAQQAEQHLCGPTTYVVWLLQPGKSARSAVLQAT